MSESVDVPFGGCDLDLLFDFCTSLNQNYRSDWRICWPLSLTQTALHEHMIEPLGVTTYDLLFGLHAFWMLYLFSDLHLWHTSLSQNGWIVCWRISLVDNPNSCFLSVNSLGTNNLISAAYMHLWNLWCWGFILYCTHKLPNKTLNTFLFIETISYNLWFSITKARRGMMAAFGLLHTNGNNMNMNKRYDQ